MFGIAAIGLLTMFFSLVMIVSPAAWSRGILRFEAKSYFHVAEILIRLVLGAVLVWFASGTLHPIVISVVGYVFLFAGAFLLVAGETWHREFAIKSATFTNIFRPAGFFSLAFGAFIVYSALGRYFFNTE